jgi:hypothetical protein
MRGKSKTASHGKTWQDTARHELTERPLTLPAKAADLPRMAGRGEEAHNAFAPVLGGGRFTQPGADGGECLTHHFNDTRHQNGAADNSGAAASPY